MNHTFAGIESRKTPEIICNKMTKNVITVTTYSELRQKVWNILGKGSLL